MASPTTLKAFAVDAVERVVFTFIEVVAALYTPVFLSVVNGGGWHQLLDLSFAQKAVVAGVASVLVVAKALYKALVADVESPVPGFLPGWVSTILGMKKKVDAENTADGVAPKQ